MFVILVSYKPAPASKMDEVDESSVKSSCPSKHSFESGEKAITKAAAD